MSNQFPEQFARWDTFSSSVWQRYQGARYRLEGTRCMNCEEVFFPPRHGLICPNCHTREMEPYQCAHTGEIVTVAPDNLGFPATAYGESLPRQIVIIRLDDGVHIISEIMEVDDVSRVAPGARVHMVLRKHKREDTGAWVYGYRFVLS